MSTVFTLKNVGTYEIPIKPMQNKNTERNGKYDIIHPGRISHVTGGGGIIRVMQRGDVYNKNGTPYDREHTKMCWWHRVNFDGLAMGIPIRIKGKKVYCDGVFCSYSCVYAFLLDHMEKIQSKRDPNYKDSIILLMQLFEMEFPGEELVPALDWRLLKDVGNGNMFLKDYLMGLKGLRLVQHPNLVYKSVTVNYDIIKAKD
jgi:hypothetical protein